MFFKPWNHEGLRFKSRLVHPGMTRSRGDLATNIPSDYMKTYYEQRADAAALFITEFMPVSRKTNAWPGAGALWSDAHVAKWKEIVDAVHKKNTVFFAQLGHAGRNVHPALNNGELPISASPLAAPGEVITPEGKKTHVVPQQATETQIKEVVTDFKDSAANAKKAGFDGVEINAGTGLLLDQFLKTSSNQREDKYGGSIQNRARFLFEVVDGVSEVYPPNRIGVKISPVTRAHGMYTEDPKADLHYILSQVEKRGLLYANLVEPENQFGEKDGIHQIPNVAEEARKSFKGLIITNGYKSIEERIGMVEKGTANFASFAKLFAANPDLFKRLQNKHPLNEFDFKVAFGAGERGYTDYKHFEEPQAK
jgi:N-ethylmaleimide reductase